MYISGNTIVRGNIMRVLCYNFSLLVLLVSCQGRLANSKRPMNDTTQIMEVCLQEATSAKYMPSASPLFKKYKFNDSILLTSSALPLSILPDKADGHVFKIMSQPEICSIITADSILEDVPNYLIISRLERNDSGYYTQLESLSCRPYGGGGSLGLYFKKVKDSLIVVNRSSESIN